MNYSQPKTCVYQAANIVEGNLIRGLLESEGIAVELRGAGMDNAYPGVPKISETRVFVPTSQHARARDVIGRYEKGAVPHSVWHCHSCGEHNSAAFEICWQCGAEDPAAA